jgi:hypothetical protein
MKSAALPEPSSSKRVLADRKISWESELSPCHSSRVRM